MTRIALDDIFGPEHTFQWGKGQRVLAGSDVTLFGTGMMTSLCLKAADLLRGDGISAEVVHLGSIQPIDGELIAASASKTGCAVTAENATIIGGLGDAVAEVLAEACPVPMRRIGVRDQFVASGGIDELFSFHQMQPEHIAEAATKVINQRSKAERNG